MKKRNNLREKVRNWGTDVECWPGSREFPRAAKKRPRGGEIFWREKWDGLSLGLLGLSVHVKKSRGEAIRRGLWSEAPGAIEIKHSQENPALD